MAHEFYEIKEDLMRFGWPRDGAIDQFHHDALWCLFGNAYTTVYYAFHCLFLFLSVLLTVDIFRKKGSRNLLCPSFYAFGFFTAVILFCSVQIICFDTIVYRKGIISIILSYAALALILFILMACYLYQNQIRKRTFVIATVAAPACLLGAAMIIFFSVGSSISSEVIVLSVVSLLPLAAQYVTMFKGKRELKGGKEK